MSILVRPAALSKLSVGCAVVLDQRAGGALGARRGGRVPAGAADRERTVDQQRDPGGQLGIVQPGLQEQLGDQRLPTGEVPPGRMPGRVVAVAELEAGVQECAAGGARAGQEPLDDVEERQSRQLAGALRARVRTAAQQRERVELPLFRMYVQGVTFHTARANAGPHVPAVLDLIRRRRIDPARVVSETLPIADATTALAAPSLKPLFVRAPLGSARAA
ncbi:MAG: hypothetical protein QOG96_6761, partial [Pseudonocardiales bacterium]|nr:hypothetical protein [Pseudonocardiales bacterium]